MRSAESQQSNFLLTNLARKSLTWYLCVCIVICNTSKEMSFISITVGYRWGNHHLVQYWHAHQLDQLLYYQEKKIKHFHMCILMHRITLYKQWWHITIYLFSLFKANSTCISYSWWSDLPWWRWWWRTVIWWGVWGAAYSWLHGRFIPRIWNKVLMQYIIWCCSFLLLQLQNARFCHLIM